MADADVVKSRAARVGRVRERMEHLETDVLLLSVGPDLPYLTGYEAMPLERLTMLALPQSGDAQLVVPRLEAPRVEPMPELFEIVPWDETDDPIALVARLVGGARRVAIGDHTWARFVLDLQLVLPSAEFVRASQVVGPIRMVKDADEIAALRAAGHAVDEIAVAMRDVAFAGRTELDVHRELVERMLAAGHERANFAIVAAGEHAASPHHEPSGTRVIGDGELVLCDFGGTMRGYCSDITRMFSVGEPSREIADAYAVLAAAQEAGVRAAQVGVPCEAVDAAARRVITDAGFGEQFIHRVGHGIGTEAHEDPYMVAGNAAPLAPGHAFSVEPGIYFAGRFGMRLEDIVVATVDGPVRLNEAPRDIAVVA
ncbi:MAG TPA: Xaa-Pro peptidase family protein [Acidimicrobiia bacterium]|nr:Xaa-Pro peptidase family protein [Acidimicrobiia bacterium]